MKDLDRLLKLYKSKMNIWTYFIICLKDAYIFEGEIEDFTIDKKHNDKIFLSNLGTFIKTRNSLSGGSMGLFEGKKIGRKKNLEKIQKSLDKLGKQKDKIELSLSRITEELQIIKGSSDSKNIDALQIELNQVHSTKSSTNFSGRKFEKPK